MLTGDWDKLIRQLGQAGERLKAEAQKATNENGRLLEETMVGHFEAQDLGWVPLKPDYLAWKLREGLSEETLFATTTLLQNIRYHERSWHEGFVGVLRGATYQKSGESVVNIAAVHEYGTKDGRVPARPFVAPTLAECEPQISQNYQEAVVRAFK
ncbi:MAG: hypothetical protein AB1646_25310 [Thermodesulfobacteriota bacterium]